jgi:septum formation protein
MATPQLILASASPRRQELLMQIGVAFEVHAQDIDETPRATESAETYVQRMAVEKARSAQTAFPDALVLAADTTVVCDENVLGKPEDEDDALAMLAQLSGRSHRVLTAVAVASADALRQALSHSEVRFRDISSAEARRYWQTGEPRGKAGAYAIQGLGAVFVADLVGSYSGVMGLPLYETAALLSEFQQPVWQTAGKPVQGVPS